MEPSDTPATFTVDLAKLGYLALAELEPGFSIVSVVG